MTIARIGRPHWQDRGERIEKARDWIGYTQGDLAEILEQAIEDRTYSRTTISNIEKGERDLRADELTAFAYLLDQDEGWLNCEPEAEFNPLAERRSPEVVHSLNLNRVPLSGRPIVDYRSFPTVRAYETTDRDYRPIDIHANIERLVA